MVKNVIWSERAQNDRKQILRYWIEHNKSKTYSLKLNQLFKEAVSLLVLHPQIGIQTDFGKVRSKLVRDYRIFYESATDCIHILAIWDCHQDPEKLKL